MSSREMMLVEAPVMPPPSAYGTTDVADVVDLPAPFAPWVVVPSTSVRRVLVPWPPFSRSLRVVGRPFHHNCRQLAGAVSCPQTGPTIARTHGQKIAQLTSLIWP